jgi:hypothetical protein
MKTAMQARVIYTNHQGVKTSVDVDVNETFAYGDIEKPNHYSAQNLLVLGCGKPDKDPIGAIHRLMGDHGQVIAIQPIQN